MAFKGALWVGICLKTEIECLGFHNKIHKNIKIIKIGDGPNGSIGMVHNIIQGWNSVKPSQSKNRNWKEVTRYHLTATTPLHPGATHTQNQ